MRQQQERHGISFEIAARVFLDSNVTSFLTNASKEFLRRSAHFPDCEGEF